MTALPILLLPVYRGGQMFREAIQSIQPCLPWFDSVVISLNGENVDEDETTALELNQLCRLTILSTRRNFTSVQHLQFISRQLNKTIRLAPDTPLFILCHDDLLHRPGFERLDQKQWREWGSNCISLGDYLVFGQTSSSASPRHESWFARYDALNSRPKSAFLMTQYQRHDDPFTNLSGMRLSLGVLRSTVRYFSITRSRSGMRMEYSLIVNKAIQNVINFDPPLVCVREHSGSVGANVSRRDFAASELRYAIWIWLNCRSIPSWKLLLQGQYGVSGLFRLIQIFSLHRYYDLLGRIRSWMARRGMI